LVVKINYEKAVRIAKALKPLKSQIEDLYLRDPQYIAIERLVRARGCNEAFVLVVLNSIVSYKLRSTGEEYWACFADYFSERAWEEPTLGGFREFLVKCGNVLLMEQKLKRVGKVLSAKLVEALRSAALDYCKNIRELIANLAKTLGSDTSSKTVIFAGKMYGYVCYACGAKPYFSDIGIPVDFRNTALALISCLLEGCRGKLGNCVRDLMNPASAKLVQKAWQAVCDELSISCLHLDTFTWLVTRKLLDSGLDVIKAAKAIEKDYGLRVPLDALRILVECSHEYV